MLFLPVTEVKVNDYILHTTGDGRQVRSRVQEIDQDGDTVYIKHAWVKWAEAHDVHDCVVVE